MPDAATADDIRAFTLVPPSGYVRVAEGTGAPGPEAGWAITGISPTWATSGLRPRLTGVPVATLTRTPTMSSGPVNIPTQFSRPTFTRAVTESARADARTIAPFAAVGRLEARFTSAGEQRSETCTAWVVAERVVVTAAHCVFRPFPSGVGGTPAGTITFAPQYHGEPTVGVWVGTRSYTLSGWVAPDAGQNRALHDFAVVVLDRPLAEVTGTLGLLARRAPEGAVLSLGYPLFPTQDWPTFDGRFLYVSHGEILGRNGGELEARNELTEGSSGGPWLILHDGQPVAVGINSTKSVGSDDTTFSPIFSDSLLKLVGRALADLTGV